MSFMNINIKAYESKYVLLVTGVIFVVSLSLLIFGFSMLDELSIEQKIEYITRTLSIIAIICSVFIATIHTYYTVILAEIVYQGRTVEFMFEKLNGNKVESKINSSESKLDQLIPESFYKAIDKLGNEKIEARLGAIYSLEQIAKNAPQHHWTVMEILAAFIRENASQEEERDFRDDELSKLPTDIQAALIAIGRRDVKQDPKNQKLDLRDIDIRGADLAEANFQSMDLTGANLQEAILYAANLKGVDLSGANLSGAIFNEANLQDAMLYEANLQEAILKKANLCEAILYQANLQGASLYDANLTGAILYDANLTGAILCDANLSGAILEGSNLTGANLIGSNLQEANLMGAKLNSALLSIANLESCILYEANLSKANLYEANLSMANLIGADFKDAILQETNLCGAELTKARNLQPEQVELAIGDCTTILPNHLEVPADWIESIVNGQ